MKSIHALAPILLMGTLVQCNLVPMVLWNINGSSLHLQPVSAFESGTKFTTLLKEILTDSSNSIVVFLVEKLSMEDLASKSTQDASKNNILKNLENFLIKHPYMMFPSMKDPMKHLRGFQCGIEDIDARKNIFVDDLQKSIIKALEKSCVVVVHLSEDSKHHSLEGAERMFRLALESNVNKNLIGLFTGLKSSWQPPKDQPRKSRSLLASEDEKEVSVSTEIPAVSNRFLNFTGCLIMYAQSISLKVGEKAANESVQLPFPPDLGGSDCGNESTLLSLTFGKVEEYSQVVLTMTFDRRGSSWRLANSSAEISGGQAPQDWLELTPAEPLEAALGFSFSCGSFRLVARNASTPVSVTLAGFQVQPYEVNDGAFASSFDCVPFFTIPIWMGIFVALLFIGILNMGIYALFSIKTMDQFDDPKGKTITVPLGAE